MKKCRCHNIPNKGNFIVENTYSFDYIIDGIYVIDEMMNKIYFTDIEFLLSFEKTDETV